ncbi:hypothetical protein, partial [Neisseria sp. P0018.S004]|uniref:hypothetical protein n=1 Tax=unclassified Neisseria TaxID=2623750 RepID=UPI003F7F7D67
DVFGDHGLGGLLKEGAHGKSPKCLSRNLGDFRGFCKGLRPSETYSDGLCFQVALSLPSSGVLMRVTSLNFMKFIFLLS